MMKNFLKRNHKVYQNSVLFLSSVMQHWVLVFWIFLMPMRWQVAGPFVSACRLLLWYLQQLDSIIWLLDHVSIRLQHIKKWWNTWLDRNSDYYQWFLSSFIHMVVVLHSRLFLETNWEQSLKLLFQKLLINGTSVDNFLFRFYQSRWFSRFVFQRILVSFAMLPCLVRFCNYHRL